MPCGLTDMTATFVLDKSVVARRLFILPRKHSYGSYPTLVKSESLQKRWWGVVGPYFEIESPAICAGVGGATAALGVVPAASGSPAGSAIPFISF